MLYQLWSLCLIGMWISCSPTRPYYQIRIRDSETGRGIPLAELKTLNQVSYFTDSQGYIAYNEPGLMQGRVYFEISSPGYHYPQDSTGRSAVRLAVKPGGQAEVAMQRIDPAERLYRITGAGIYRDSEWLGVPVPLRQPDVRAGVLGQDSNLDALYKGRLFWVWGDTFLPDDYHGNFAVAGATSALPTAGGMDPAIGIELDYFVDERGWSRPMYENREPGYVWFDWLMTITDRAGSEQLIAKYARVNAYFGNYERGIAVFNDSTEQFERYRQVPAWLPEYHNCHHPFRAVAHGNPHFYLSSEFDFSRVAPQLAAIADPAAYEYFSCLNPQTGRPDRDAAGKLRYDWKRDVPATSHERQQELIRQGHIHPEEAWIHLLDVETGDPVEINRGSVFWNAYRQRWILIMGNKDIWFAEADTPVGPWGYARKVASHDILFYNPRQHPLLDQEGGKDIFFEGTYTQFFGQGTSVPRYNYNQLMYHLQLDDPRLKLPVPIYHMRGGQQSYISGAATVRKLSPDSIRELAFWAMEKAPDSEAFLPLYASTEGGKTRLRTYGDGQPLFYALSPEINYSPAWEGKWEADFDFLSINRSLSFSLQQVAGGWQVQSQKASFQLSGLAIEDRVLKLQLQHEGDTYTLTARIHQGRITGNWKTTNGTRKGTWKGGKAPGTSWVPYGSSLRELWEERNVQTGEYIYSLAPGVTPGYTRTSNRPLCRVWAHPTEVAVYDFSILPE